MFADAAIIGGTGVGSLLSELGGQPVHIPTQFGMVRGKKIQVGAKQVVLLSRHSAGHAVPPHRVNYLAIAAAVRAVGAKVCFASAAVGSLNPEVGVGSLMVCDDFLDLTGRNLTAFDQMVIHTPFSQPFGTSARRALLDSASRVAVEVIDGGVYIGLNGPRFETPAEIRMLARVGDVVGMTASSEAIAMKEQGVEYGLLAIVTNLGEGLGGAVDHGLVGKAMVELGPKAVEIFKGAVESF
ncbi:MAG TPA: MTAP family purine nucleoside phosphorylase [Fimbriimonadaceae bacterium]|nr:MTAP family purine nucleoside phosphorylase [Fimbriimonadaceae bacterium]